MKNERKDSILNREKLIGKKGINNQGYPFTVIAYRKYADCDIQFDNCGTIVSNKNYNVIKNGGIENPYHPSVCDIGFEGQGKYSFKVYKKIHNRWSGMIQRCYDKREQENCSSYRGCSVDERWHNFQNFAEWFENNYVEGFHLDKDILFKGNKIYSSDVCRFVPIEINNLFTYRRKVDSPCLVGVMYDKVNNKFRAQISINGKSRALKRVTSELEAFYMYKAAKELQIKKLADVWRHKLKEDCYQALINWKIEISD